MARFFRVALFAALALAFVTAGAYANIPDPEFSQIPDMIVMSPDGSAVVTMTISGSSGPVVGALVEMEFSLEADGLIAWTGAGDPYTTGPGGGKLFSQVTDSNGQVFFHIGGSGCVAHEDHSPYTVQIRADNFLMGEAAANSPDAVDNAGNLPEDLGYSICDQATSQTAVGLADALYHTPQIKSGAAEVCTDFSGPDYTDATNLADASFVTPYIKGGTNGPCTYNGP